MKVKVIKTQKNEYMVDSCLSAYPDTKGREDLLINIYPYIEYQMVEGFGGAFTEAAATTLNKLSEENQEKFFKLYFDKTDGIAYNYGRVHINSCDFSLGNYTCVDEGDETLSTFQVERDKTTILPMAKRALRYGDIEIMASPWSPPAYMKTTGQMNRGGKLKDEYKDLWAEYYAKFIDAYKENGVEISSVSVQNEPKATQAWDSCVYTAEEERDFVKNHLGPKMREKGIKVFFWDHNKERIVDRASVMMDDEKACDCVDGIAFHWYSGDHFEELEMFHKLYPNKKLVFTEGCYEYYLGEAHLRSVAERYAHDIIGNFNNYCNAFCDWNLLLDEQGGPNHVQNYCHAPIMADVENDVLMINDAYYYIGHFSKYIEKGAVRIGSSKFSSNIETVSFRNPNGTIVSVVLNRTDTDIDFAFRLCNNIVEDVAKAHSISTYIFE